MFDDVAASLGKQRLRWQIWLLGCLLSATVLQGCSSDDPLTGSTAGQRSNWTVTRSMRKPGTPQASLSPVSESQMAVRWSGSWTRNVAGGPDGVARGRHRVTMRLELPDARGEASIELTIGDAVYRSDASTKTTVQPRPGDRGTYRNSTGGEWKIEGPVGGGPPSGAYRSPVVNPSMERSAWSASWWSGTALAGPPNRPSSTHAREKAIGPSQNHHG